MSRGISVKVVGTKEVRTAVAVKEVAKTGESGQQRAMREFMLLSQKLQPQHVNIIRVFGIESAVHAIYVVMALCHFPLSQQPASFRAFVHGGGGGGGAGGADGGGGGVGRRSSSGDSALGAIVLNALVQDLLRGVSFLHSKGVAHCDLKPANVLVSFDRSGRQREMLPRNFNMAQLKITDFGVSRVLQQQQPSHDGTMTTTMTATVTVDSKQVIAGSEAYMCPELLRLLNAVRHGELLSSDAEATTEMLLDTDAFACGCLVAFLCGREPGGTSSIKRGGSSGGGGSSETLESALSSSPSSSSPSLSRELASLLHPFYSSRGSLRSSSSITDNIMTGRRRPLAELRILEPRHQELVDRFTTCSNSKPPAPQRWAVCDAAAQSAVFSTDPTTDSAASELMAIMELRVHQPQGSCLDQLLSPALVSAMPQITSVIGDIATVVKRLVTGEARVPTKLKDPDSCVSCCCRLVAQSGTSRLWRLVATPAHGFFAASAHFVAHSLDCSLTHSLTHSRT